MLTEAFRKAGIDARSISSLTHPQLRKDTLDGFKKGDFKVLVNCEVLTEGADVPVVRDCRHTVEEHLTKTDRLCDSGEANQKQEPPSSNGKASIQRKISNLTDVQIGRGLRLSPESGKEDCYIIDIVDSMSGGIVATPSLLGLSHDAMEMEERREKAETDIAPEGEIHIGYRLASC
jgi:ATP-dependent helicase IRC3